MSKKILVIGDAEEFRTNLNLATIRSRCVVEDVMDLLKDYEEDVIGFEAEVEVDQFYTHRGEGIKKRTIELPSSAIVKMGIPNHGAKFQIYVVKPKKPEGKDDPRRNAVEISVEK